MANTIPFVAPVPDTLTDEDILGALDRLPVPFQEVIMLSDVEEADVQGNCRRVSDSFRNRDVAPSSWPRAPAIGTRGFQGGDWESAP